MIGLAGSFANLRFNKRFSGKLREKTYDYDRWFLGLGDTDRRYNTVCKVRHGVGLNHVDQYQKSFLNS